MIQSKRKIAVKIRELPYRAYTLDSESIGKIFGGECVQKGEICICGSSCCTSGNICILKGAYGICG